MASVADEVGDPDASDERDEPGPVGDDGTDAPGDDGTDAPGDDAGRMAGEGPEVDGRSRRETFAELLHAAAVSGDAAGARELVAEMERGGLAPTSDDHLLVLVAHELSGRAEDAEAYFRGLPWLRVTEAHLQVVLGAYALVRRPADVERLYREFEAGPLPPDDECRVMLLGALASDRDHRRAREWVDSWSIPPDSPGWPAIVARLVDAHAHPEAREELAELAASLGEGLRRDPEVTVALVQAFARADDPARAEAWLELALEVVDDPDLREVMVSSCLAAYDRQLRPAVERLAALADELGIPVDHSGPRRPG